MARGAWRATVHRIAGVGHNLATKPLPPLSYWASQVALIVKNLPANADVGLISGLGRSPGGGHGNSLLYSCLENPRDKGAWQTAVHRVTQSGT